MDVGHLGEIERGQGNPTAETCGRMVEALETTLMRIGELTHEFLEGQDWWGLGRGSDSTQTSRTNRNQSRSVSRDQVR